MKTTLADPGVNATAKVNKQETIHAVSGLLA
jgi:hypothetical protein